VILAVLLLLAPAGAAAAQGSADEPAAGSRRDRITVVATPMNLGRFTFQGDGGLAYDPNLRLAAAVAGAYSRTMGRSLFLGCSLAYLHTLAPYGGDYSEETVEDGDEGMRGYSDILRPLAEAGWIWGAADEDIDFAAGLGAGPAFAWFEDLRMAGIDVAARASAVFWLTAHAGLHLAARLSFDYLWAYGASGWAADRIEGAEAYTLFLSLDLGLSVGF
jgi:hypothetical protein